MTGLLHDIGKVVLDMICTDDYAKTCRFAATQEKFLYEVEGKLGPALHTEAGARLGEHWNLAQNIIHGIRWHHEPAKVLGTTAIPAVIHAADALSHQAARAAGGKNFVPPLHPQVIELLSLDAAALQQLLDTLHIEMMAADAFLSLGAA